jgi:hypothetical protein
MAVPSKERAGLKRDQVKHGLAKAGLESCLPSDRATKQRLEKRATMLEMFPSKEIPLENEKCRSSLEAARHHGTVKA